ncbi:hypothetical protein PILCRDRAFT_819571 [Piloderma croceum F 1598]|uniref:Kinesin light chain n=1 Tax=Piloderma croceum (strain F 1598) TaxID=765440 RepID=A0A0C3FYJ8_PILCF|nr:hypothetical protein PILCRDRAFT_819571 [Piloderma croceum F 1598]
MIQEGVRREHATHHWFRIAVVLACSAFRHIDNPASHTGWAQFEMLGPHIQSLASWDDEYAAGIFEASKENTRITNDLTSQEHYNAMAEILYRRVLAGNEKLLGPEHPATLRAMANLANVYSSQGQYSKAETVQASRGHIFSDKNPIGLHVGDPYGSVTVRQAQ